VALASRACADAQMALQPAREPQAQSQQ